MDGETAAGASPASPGLPPVRLTEAIEDLLFSTLSSSTEQGSLGVDLGLSAEYCSGLLRDDPSAAHSHLDDGGHCSKNGVPGYPLYKHLAWAIATGGLPRRGESMIDAIPVDQSRKIKEDEWNQLIIERGLELSKMLASVEFEIHVQEPFFSQLRAGMKTVEGRCATGNYNSITEGSLLLLNKCLLLEVQHIKHYSSFSEMLRVETLDKVLPGVKTIEEGVQIYRKFYTEEKERSNGCLAISVSKPASQPYISMANLLSGLGYDGLGYLLGMAHTGGTVPDALPPPRSVLLSSAMKCHQPNVKGCLLTDAGRALTKHVCRSSKGWWGNVHGNDLIKNRLALEAIDRLLAACCWMNVHMVQPYECVFEIRVPEGYGARWSKCGLKLIGFLEPYMEEGHSKGWKH